MFNMWECGNSTIFAVPRRRTETAVRCRSGRIGRSGASPAAERSLLSQYSLLQQWLALPSPHRDQTSPSAAQMAKTAAAVRRVCLSERHGGSCSSC